MQTSLPYYQQDYQQPYSCGFHVQQTHNTYNPLACHYPQPRPVLVDWPGLALYNPSGSHANLSPRLRFHMPAYRCTQRGWRGRRGTITSLSPPAVARSVTTLSSPFTDDLQLSGTHCAAASSSQERRAQSSTRPNPTSLSAHPLLNWLNCGLLEQPGRDVPVLSSDHICRSLVDTSQQPAALNDAICMYIDYLTRDNDRVIGELSVLAGDHRLDTALSTMVNDQLYRDVFCQPSSFPTSRFREWLQIYSVDLEITDPEGRRLTQATFPGCGCEVHQVADRMMNDLTACQHNASMSASQNTGASWSQSSLQAEQGQPAVTVPRQPALYSTNTRELCALARSRRGRGRGRCGRGSGRGRAARRKSETEYNAVSYRQCQQTASDVRRASSSTECNDDCAVVEFLASLQSDAVKRRCRQQQHQLAVHDAMSHGQDKVIEEVVDDEIDVGEPPRSQIVPAQPLNILPPSTLTDSHFTDQDFLPLSSPAVFDRCCSVPVKVADVDDPSDVIGKSSEQ